MIHSKDIPIHLNQISISQVDSNTLLQSSAYSEAIKKSKCIFPYAIPVLSSAYQLVSNNLGRLGYKILNCDVKFNSPEPRDASPTHDDKTVLYFFKSHLHLAELAGLVWGTNSIKTIQDHCSTKYVTVLFPVGESTNELFSRISTLRESGISIGIIPISDNITDWSTVICYLLSDSLNDPSRINLYISSVWNYKAPPSSINEKVGIPDIVLFSGHANPADMRISDDLILCGRASASQPNSRSLPCWNSEHCGKQHHLKRSDISKVGLTSINQLYGHVNVLSGCNLAPLGSRWLGTAHSLVDQLVCDGLQAVVSTTLITKDIQLDLLFVALMNDGYSLGEAIDSLNSTRANDHREVSPTDKHPGTFILLGNPALKLPSRIDSDSGWNVDLGSQGKVQIKYIPTDHISGLPRDIINCSFSEEMVRKLYIFGIERSLEHKGLVQHRFDQSIVKITPLLKESLVNSVFWERWSAYFVAVPNQVRTNQLSHQALMDYTTEFQKECTLLVNAFRRRKYYLDYELEELINYTIEKIRVMHELAIKSVCSVIATHGSLLFKGWQHLFLRESVCQLESNCYCEQFPVTSFKYKSFVQPGAFRYIYECFGCGVVGEDNGTETLSINEIPRQANKNTTFLASFDLNINNEDTFFSALLSIEPWGASKEIEGHIVTELIHTNSRIELQINIPTDIPKGKYSLNVIFIINGALIQKRRPLKVI